MLDKGRLCAFPAFYCFSQFCDGFLISAADPMVGGFLFLSKPSKKEEKPDIFENLLILTVISGIMGWGKTQNIIWRKETYEEDYRAASGGCYGYEPGCL